MKQNLVYKKSLPYLNSGEGLYKNNVSERVINSPTLVSATNKVCKQNALPANRRKNSK